MKTLQEMQEEVLTLCKEKGWYDKPVSFAESMALIHSEISEALDAYRRWDLSDSTEHCDILSHTGSCPHTGHKPEGVGSEFADIFIRLLDDRARYEIQELEEHERNWHPVTDSFGGNINMLHDLVSRASEHFKMSDDVEVEFSDIYTYLLALCKKYNVDLMAEYERKMAFNWTRPYRHGRKHY